MGRNCRGLSVLEVLIALSVLTVAGLAIIATLTRAMVAQSSSSHQTVGRLIAESELQRAVLFGPPNWGPPGVSLTDVREHDARVGQNARLVKYRFQVDVTPFSRENESGTVMFSTHPEPGPFKDMGRLWEVSVRIWWNADQSAQSAVEKGRQELTVSKVTYIEE